MRLKSLAAILFIASAINTATAQTSPQPNTPTTPVFNSGNIVFVPQPEFACIQTASFQKNGDTLHLSFTSRQPINLQHDSMLVLVSLASGRVIVSTLGEATVSCWGIGKNQTGIVSVKSNSSTVTGSATVANDTFSLTVQDSSLANEEIRGVSTAFADEATVLTNGMSVLDEVPHSYFPFQSSDNWIAPTIYKSQSNFPPVEGPYPWGSPPFSTTPRPGDINGDGKPDWRPGGGVYYPGTDIIAERWILDRGAPGNDGQETLIIVIGIDSNHNGTLEPGEALYIISECIYVPGCNIQYGKMENGHYVHHLINIEDTNRNGKLDPGEHYIHYVYDIASNTLKVFDEHGNLIWSGSPSDVNWENPPWWH